MIKNLLRKIRRLFGLLDLKGENNPYPLNSSPEINVNTFSPYPDAYGNFENQSEKKQLKPKYTTPACMYFINFKEGDPKIEMLMTNKDESNKHSSFWDGFPHNSEIGPYHHSNDQSSSPYESDSSSNSNNDSSDW